MQANAGKKADNSIGRAVDKTDSAILWEGLSEFRYSIVRRVKHLKEIETSELEVRKARPR